MGKQYVVHETLEEHVNRTIFIDVLYNGILTLFIGAFIYGLGQLNFLFFRNIDNVFIFSFFVFMGLMFRRIIKDDRYHNFINSIILPFVSILFLLMVFLIITESIRNFEFSMFIIMFFMNLLFGYEIRKTYNRSYLGRFIKIEINKRLRR